MFLVYLFFAVAIVGVSVLAGTVVAREAQAVANRVNDQFRSDSHGVTPADRKLSELQRWLNRTSPVKVNVKGPGERLLHHVDVSHLQRYSGRAVAVVQSLVITLFESLFNLVLVIVVSVYMLLDAPRLSRFLRRVFPGSRPEDDLVTRVERALLAYVRGQTMVSLAVGATAGIGLWILGVTGVFPAGQTYALVFAAFAAVVEIIPYVGPWLGALAPVAVAATQSGTAVIAVALLFLFIHQIEGHIIVPKLMGGAVKVHPLVVIFALLAAGELYGLAGVLLAMPLVAIGREVSAFLLERIGLEHWRGGPIALEVGVEDIGGPGDEPADDRPAPVPAAGE